MYKVRDRIEYRLPYTNENTRRCSCCKIKMVGGPQVKVWTDTGEILWFCPFCDPKLNKNCKPGIIGGG